MRGYSEYDFYDMEYSLTLDIAKPSESIAINFSFYTD